MATYRITTPDGSTYNVTAPDSASQDEVMAYAQKQHTAAATPPSAPTSKSEPSLKGSVAGGALMGLRDPIDGLAQLVRRAVPDSVGNAIDAFGNKLADIGLPVARSSGVQGVDDVVRSANLDYDQARDASGRSGLDVARIAGNIANPINRVVPMAGAASLPAIAGRAAAQGAVSGLTAPTTQTDNFARSKIEQTGLGAAAGAVGGVVVGKFADALSSVVGRIQSSLPGASAKAAAGADDAINQAAQAAGMDLSQIPKSMLDQVRQQTTQALASGKKFDAAAALRQTEGNMVLPKAPLTLGQVTRDPQQFANEMNLRGVNGAGRPLAERFAAQNAGLIDAMNMQGAARAPGEFNAGNALIRGLTAADAETQQGVNQLYTAAKSLNGADIPIDHRAFADTAMKGLDASIKGAFLPAEVKGILNDISSGKTPLTVTVAEQLKTIIGNASASAKDGNVREALGIVRRALDDAQPLGGGREVLDAFGVARSAAKARFAGLETNPAMRSAINGAQPDDFFRKHVINGDVEGVNKLIASLRGTGDEGRALGSRLLEDGDSVTKLGGPSNALSRALAAEAPVIDNTRDQVVAYLKGKALNGAADEIGSFSQSSYNKALQSIGDEKLATLFSKAEVEQLKRVGRVAGYTQAAPQGSAVNSSNTAASVMNLLSGLSGHVGTWPGVNIAAKSFREFQQSQAAKNALMAKLLPETEEGQTNALRALMAPGAGAFGSLAAELRR